MKGMVLRLAIATGLTVAAGLSAASAAPTPHQSTRVSAWCAVTSLGSENCGFSTQAQCQSAVSGLGGFCRMTASTTGQGRRLS